MAASTGEVEHLALPAGAAVTTVLTDQKIEEMYGGGFEKKVT